MTVVSMQYNVLVTYCTAVLFYRLCAFHCLQLHQIGLACSDLDHNRMMKSAHPAREFFVQTTQNRRRNVMHLGAQHHPLDRLQSLRLRRKQKHLELRSSKVILPKDIANKQDHHDKSGIPLVTSTFAIQRSKECLLRTRLLVMVS